MENIVLLNMLVLGSIALVAAVILYVVSKKFAVKENPKIAEIEELLPQANCGGCGKAGCHDFGWVHGGYGSLMADVFHILFSNQIFGRR